MNEQRADRWAVNALILLVLFGIGVYVRDQAGRADRQAERAEAALCEIRSNTAGNLAEDRKAKARSLKYLADVKAGLRKPIPGITKADIDEGLSSRQRSIERQRRTVAALGGLDC